MAKLLRWSAPHVKLSVIEKMTGIHFGTLRAYHHPDFGFPVSVRIAPEDRERLGLNEVFTQLGFDKQAVVYINI